MNRVTKDKITSREVIAPLIQEWRAAGKKVGFTSGAFDIIHAGHIQFLESTKEYCDILIVGVNTDASVQEYLRSTAHDKAEGFDPKYNKELSDVINNINLIIFRLMKAYLKNRPK